jgi:sodium-independent sulfate anion transporter 11
VSITDLVARPKVIKQLWDIDFFDFLSFLVAFIVTVFVSIEFGIYASVAFSLFVLLYRIARPQLQLLVREETGGWVSHDEVSREDPTAKVDLMPFPGIAVFRIEEALTYPNANYLSDKIKLWVQTNTDCGSIARADELLWNEKRPSHLNQGITNDEEDDAFGILPETHSKRNVLRALVFDLSAVNHIDATGLQILIDARADVESWAGEKVPFFFAHVHPEVRSSIEYFCLLPENREVTAFANNHANPVPDSENRGMEIEMKRKEEFGCDDTYLKFLIHRNIDDAVATAQNSFNFGSLSTATIGQS